MVCESFRKRFEMLPLTLLRVSTGIIMAVHGWQKLNDIPKMVGIFEQMGLPYPQMSVYLAIGGEFLGGLGLIVGLLTPIAAFGILSTMAVAVFHVHWKNGLLAQNNGFEYPLTLLLVALYFIFKGAGPISLDALCCKKCGKKEE